MKIIISTGGLLVLLGTAVAQTHSPLQKHHEENEFTANFRFETQFSESGVFDCLNGRNKIGLGVGRGGVPVKHKATTDAGATPDLRDALSVEIETWPSKNKNQIQRSWGWARFEDGDRKVTVPLDNGQTVYFERFGSTPNWPFKGKKDNQLFFTFRLDNGMTYKCKAVYQADQ